MLKHRFVLTVMSAMVALAPSAKAQIFTDNFNAGASALWGNERGSWSAAGGVYNATMPGNTPPTLSLLPFVLTDFSFDVDVNNLSDGGIWLRASYDVLTNSVNNGVLLVTGGYGQTGTGFYFHTITNGIYSAPQGSVSGLFVNQVSDPHVRVEVVGDKYSVYVNGSTTAATSLTTSAYASGYAGLYDFYGTTSFDNVEIDDLVATPEPASLVLLGTGLVGVAGFVRRRKVM